MNFKHKKKDELLNILKQLMVIDERNIFYLEHKNNFIPVLFYIENFVNEKKN
jgi:hypothetical protein